jgi:chaperone required for assembly of F1-ATPase
MKRFWQAAAVERTGATYGVALDGRPVRLPNGSALTVPFAALAQAIAAEWDEAGKNFTPADLPLTQLAGTARERVALQRPGVIEALLRYGMNDLLCYRAEAPDLAAAEEQAWDPWLHWAHERLGVTLRTTHGVLPTAQPPEAARCFGAALERMDEYQLAGLGVIVPILGSLVLGLAVAARALSPDAACAATSLDETWQEARWGSDPAATGRREAILKEVADAERFMMLCRHESNASHH